MTLTPLRFATQSSELTVENRETAADSAARVMSCSDRAVKYNVWDDGVSIHSTKLSDLPDSHVVTPNLNRFYSLIWPKWGRDIKRTQSLLFRLDLTENLLSAVFIISDLSPESRVVFLHETA